jgi:hypothetical protein
MHPARHAACICSHPGQMHTLTSRAGAAHHKWQPVSCSVHPYPYLDHRPRRQVQHKHCRAALACTATPSQCLPHSQGKWGRPRYLCSARPSPHWQCPPHASSWYPLQARTRTRGRACRPSRPSVQYRRLMRPQAQRVQQYKTTGGSSTSGWVRCPQHAASQARLRWQ